MSDFTEDIYNPLRDSTEDKSQCLSNYISDRLIEIPLIEIFPQIKTCIENYLRYGWDGLSDTYKSGKEINFDDKELNKRCNVTKAYVPIVLRAIGVIRVKLITYLFECVKDNESNLNEEKEYIQTAFGSTNLTSDHDITIGGPYPSNIVWKMYSDFVKQYDIILPFTFDSNLYCSAVYNIVSDKLNRIIENNSEKKEKLLILNVNDKKIIKEDGSKYQFYTPYITEHDEIYKQYLFGFLKLKKIPFNDIDAKYNDIKKMINKAKENIEKYLISLNRTDQSWIQDNNDLSKINISTFDRDNKQNAVNYYLQCHFSKPLEHYYHSDEVYNEVLGGTRENNHDYTNIKKILYKKDGTPSDTGTAGIVGYYSSEAYYTAAAVQVVVLEMQLKFNFKENVVDNKIRELDIHTYLTALLENLGDYYTHSNHEIKTFEEVLNETEDIMKSSSSSEPDDKRDTERINKYKKIFIKYSKYMKRVLHCLSKIKEKKQFNETKFNVSTLNTHIDKVVERREDYNIEDDSVNTLYRSEYGWGGTGGRSWNNMTFVNHVLDIISELSSKPEINQYYDELSSKEVLSQGGKKNKSYRKRNKNKKQRSYKKH